MFVFFLFQLDEDCLLLLQRCDMDIEDEGECLDVVSIIFAD